MSERTAEARGTLAGRRAELARVHERTLITTAAALGAAVALLLAAFVRLTLEVRLRREAEDAYVAKQRQATLRVQLGELLQACRTLDEAYDVASRLSAELLPATRGALYVARASRDALVLGATWGDRGAFGATLAFQGCWSVRRGQPHGHDDAVRCVHFEPNPPAHALCLTLTADGEAIGTMHVASDQPIDKEQRRLAVAVAEQIAMAISNLLLCDKLKNQSIRDPLTGLFNRRDLEETLEREIARGRRGEAAVGIIAIDVDHFKRLNDSFGHDAGDHVHRASPSRSWTTRARRTSWRKLVAKRSSS